MRKSLMFGLMLFTYAFSLGQAVQTTKPVATKPAEPTKMTPGMTEIWDPEVKIIQPGVKDSDPPSDAVVLFNGSDVNLEWEDNRGNPTKWIVKDDALVCVRGSGVIKTKRKFSNFQLHIEWRTPSEVIGESQGRGNSGVFLQELYEVQDLTAIITGHIVKVRLAVFISSVLHWLMSAGNLVNGNHMILFTQLQLLTATLHLS
jgi:hypothetical protein